MHHCARPRRSLPFLTLLLLATCGGGGGGEPPAVPTLDLGVHSATVPTRVDRTFLNPLASTATVTALPTEGPFAFQEDPFPLSVPAGAGFNLGVVFTPEGSGLATGTIGLRFAGAGGVQDMLYVVIATGETVPWTVAPDPLDFGDVLPGETAEREVRLTNDSVHSPVTFTAGRLPSAAFAYVGSPFPLAIAPQQTASFRLRFAPTAIADYGGLLRLGDDDPGGPLDLGIRAESSGSGEQTIDLGTQSLTNGDTPVLEVDVPADTVGLTFEGVMADGNVVGLHVLEGPGGKVYEDTSLSGPVRWLETRQSFAIHLPTSDEGSTQLVPGGGTYRFQLHRFAGSGMTMDVRVVLERRVSGVLTSGVLPLNVFLARGLTPTADTAPDDVNLQATMTQVAQILGAQDLELGEITYHDIASAEFDQVGVGEENALFRLGNAASTVRLNLFLVSRVWDGNLLGLSGSIDGAKRNGDSATGVVCFYYDAQPGALAVVIAHEICHYLGLWHTVESTGEHDRILDTPDCPAIGTDSVCTVEGGDLLMHWRANGGRIMTNGQGRVIRSHALVHPVGQSGQLRAKPSIPATRWQPDEETRAFLESLPAGWCGTRHR